MTPAPTLHRIKLTKGEKRILKTCTQVDLYLNKQMRQLAL